MLFDFSKLTDPGDHLNDRIRCLDLQLRAWQDANFPDEPLPALQEFFETTGRAVRELVMNYLKIGCEDQAELWTRAWISIQKLTQKIRTDRLHVVLRNFWEEKKPSTPN
jgi:hypothetical protein